MTETIQGFEPRSKVYTFNLTIELVDLHHAMCSICLYINIRYTSKFQSIGSREVSSMLCCHLQITCLNDGFDSQ